ncbi:unnamed protein product [Gongylonema pulchrum]|uniref:Dynein light chain n=1 Tax=Gongylonema pulchrum TaxID=637853 RepID=A0A183D6B4_9BILA|nr:unnamed protein product [Gongylonema pulchrum]
MIPQLELAKEVACIRSGVTETVREICDVFAMSDVSNVDQERLKRAVIDGFERNDPRRWWERKAQSSSDARKKSCLSCFLRHFIDIESFVLVAQAVLVIAGAAPKSANALQSEP